MKIIQHRSIILLNIKCPQLSKPKARATVARIQNYIRLQNGEKNTLGKIQPQLGANSPLANKGTVITKQIGSKR